MKARKWGLPVALTAAVLMISGPVAAQEEEEAGPMTQGDDAVYISVTHIKFKSGKRERAMEIINEYFAPAGEKAGTPPPMLGIHYQTGRWDAAWVWELEGGMADLEWYRSPEDIKWWQALIEIAGGEEEAGEIWGEWSGSIKDSITEVGHYHTGEDAE